MDWPTAFTVVGVVWALAFVFRHGLIVELEPEQHDPAQALDRGEKEK